VPEIEEFLTGCVIAVVFKVEKVVVVVLIIVDEFKNAVLFNDDDEFN
jgi:hypothetical protein